MPTSRKLFGIRLLLIAVMAALGAWSIGCGAGEPRSKPQSKKTKAEPQPLPLSREAQESVKNAGTLQAEGKWKEAVDAWQSAIAKIGDRTDERLNAENQLRICESELKRSSTVPPEQTVRVTPADDPPKKITDEDLAAWYPKGKKLRSVAILDIQGRGTNEHWGLKEEASFAFQARVETETEVLASLEQSGCIRFQQKFAKVAQNLAVSNHTLELKPVENPLSGAIWDLADRQMSVVPHYVVLRQGIEILKALDPNLKVTLTSFADRLGLDPELLPGQTKLIGQLNRLTGTTVEVEYVSGIGVTEIKPISGAKLTEAELLNLAHSMSMGMDYYVFPSANKKVGETWTVRAQDVAGVIAVQGMKVDVEGEMELRRDRDAGEIAVLSVRNGHIEVKDAQAERQSAKVSGELTIKEGEVKFDQPHKYIRKAELAFKASGLWNAREFLLWDTKGVRDLDVRSHYHAELVEGEK